MARAFLNLFLALSLILNGGALPWAMANGDACAHHLHAEQTVPVAAPVDSAQHHDSAGSAHCGSQSHDGKGGSCCDGRACKCGCVSLPIALIVRVQLYRQGLAAAPVGRVEPALIARRGSPPFRPPTI